MNRLLIVFSLFCFICSVVSDEHTHTYEYGEEVVIWMNTVGPYHNRQETYSFFTLPFCRGPKKAISHVHESLGENLSGFELAFSGLDVQYKENVKASEYCFVELNEKSFKAFEYAIKNHYWYQMFVDDLPMWALVGDFGHGHKDDEKSTDQMYIWTHKKFDFGYNGDQIVDVNVTTGQRVLLKPGITLHFTYEINWKPSQVNFAKRFEKYLDPHFFQHRIHWFSIFNSFMMVIFLVGIVSMILMRTLKKDFARYSKDDRADDLEKDLGDEYGWKLIHGDVFRPPESSLFLTVFLGTGSQLIVATLCVVLLAIVGDLYIGRGSLLTSGIFVHAATSPVAGYVGGALYSRFGGKEWIKQTLYTALVFPGAVGSIAFFINMIAIYYNATRAIPFTTMLVMSSLWAFVVLPLTLVGAVLGRSISGQTEVPCRINPVARPIPEKRWHMEPWFMCLVSGILPFGSIFIEMYFVFTSFWAYKIYYVYGFLLLVLIILTIVTACVAIVATYFLLNSEDHQWHWRSFACGGSIGVYVYLYSIYYFFFKTKMFGVFQTTFYFGYMLMFTLLMTLMCGTFGYFGSSLFVDRIYRSVKVD